MPDRTQATAGTLIARQGGQAVSASSGLALPALFAPDEAAARRFVELFAAHIRNPNTRRAYARAAVLFADWCEAHGLRALRDIEPVQVALYIESLQARLAAPSVKLHLAAIRMLCDWLVVGQVIAINPASSVRGPRHSVKKGKRPPCSPPRRPGRCWRPLPRSHRWRCATGRSSHSWSTPSPASARPSRCASRMSTCRATAPGCGCTKRAASSMRCPAITTWRPTCTPTSTAQASAATARAGCSAPPWGAPVGSRSAPSPGRTPGA